ncbi:MAG: agmatinase [Candidatus Marinimicrobia bacterium]|nr:agmatinase [Candidatus Neomarinimicrobiota bacterium]
MELSHEFPFLASEIDPRPPTACGLHVIPAPLEASVSYGPGTGRGPAAILRASNQLECWDGWSFPAELGIFTWPATDCAGTAAGAVAAIQAAVARAVACGGWPVVLGGEHTVTYGALQALRPGRPALGVVQFDAHADLRLAYEGNRLSHASVMRRALELDTRLFQIGVRACCAEDLAIRAERHVAHLDAAHLARAGLPPAPLLPADFPDEVYLTFDLDAFDPGFMPAVGTPEPGGLDWWTTLRLLEAVFHERRVIGCDIVELAPRPACPAADFIAARLVYQLMGLHQRQRG